MSELAVLDIDLARVLGDLRVAWQTETQLQDGIAAALATAGVPFGREHRLTAGDRIDFLAFVSGGPVGIEVKTAGSVPAVARQLQRYAHSPVVHRLLLATTRPQHAEMPDRLGGVPVSVVVMRGGAW